MSAEACLVRAKQQHKGVQSQANRQEAVHGSVKVVRAEQGSQAVAKALGNLGDVEVVAGGLTVDGTTHNGSESGQTGCQPASQEGLSLHYITQVTPLPSARTLLPFQSLTVCTALMRVAVLVGTATSIL